MTANSLSRTLERPGVFKYLLIAPAVFVILLIGLYPLIKLAVTSFQDISMFGADYSFNGAKHYVRLFGDSRLWESLLHTVLFTAVALPIELVLGYLLALLFLERLPGKSFFVAIILLPTIISPIVAGSTWRLMIDQRFGPVNQILSWIAGREVELLWNIQTYLVWPAIMIAEVWQWTPFMFLMLYAALSNVDKEQLEAAQIDGASWWMTFRRIVLPAIMPVMVIAMLIRALDLFRIFDIIWTMTQGGPGTMTETISIYAYNIAFREFETSYSAAIAFLVIFILTLVVVWLLRRVEVER
ncbi:carbohydrate ABC transporter membrane protein 1 (CUT1 family) [Primorskyibacter sedentarius]|uniref:Carbohydrate ABC transporter membrane protein 1 (CUT1 family) n=1 Tax=Primorskyibacter sedentarius TaxID=745311 RepID=A0A4R3J984_9RHOB|nr:sugar ABC transporter permease [Primorskyibacter sedentarius]TCS61513.1 carbohydrate ABC transporter membrane protein 1 (CUT1 family) [Primorskyibacter sedentarius]